MSLKTKLTSLITTFVLLCSLLTVGVFAVKNTTFNVGGKIEFTVEGIEATIALSNTGLTNVALPEGVTVGEDVFKTIIIDNTTTADSVASQFAKWSNLDLSFAGQESTASIELVISNTSADADNFIDITALADATTKNNAKIKVENNAGGITALVGKGQSATFTITFSVIDDEYKASLNGFNVNFDMKKVDRSEIPTTTSLSETFTFGQYDTDNYTATVYAAGVDPEGDPSSNTYNLSGDITIPSYVIHGEEVYKVNAIGWAAFGFPDSNGCELNSVTIPNTVENIEVCAFALCTISNDVRIPESITNINENAFLGTSIPCVTISGMVGSVPSYSFCSSSIKKFVLEEGITNIGMAAFSECGIEEITLPNTLKTIAGSAFTYSSLKNITIPNSVTSVGDNAFLGCSDLTNVTMSENVTTIDAWLFNSCHNLSGFTIPNGVTSIGPAAFIECTSLTSITIPESVTSIGESAFGGCENLSTVYIDSSVIANRDRVEDCLIDYATAIYVNSSIKTLGKYFYRYKISNETTVINGVSYNKLTEKDTTEVVGNLKYDFNLEEATATVYMVDAENTTGVISIPQNVTSSDGSVYTVTAIKESAFERNNNITKVTLPSTIQSIGACAFSFCKELQSINIPNGIKSINDGTFGTCIKLKTITLPDSVETIGVTAFNGSGLETITLSKNLKYFGDAAFASCKSLISFKIPDSVTSIFSNLLQQCDALESIDFGNGITEIPEEMFKDFVNLKSVKFGNNLQRISINAFYGCSSLQNIVIPDSVTFVGDAAFAYCTSLETLAIGSGVDGIDVQVFVGCSNLRSVVINKNLSYIGYDNFGGCVNLTNVYYTGTAQEWSQIEIVDADGGNDAIINATKTYNYVIQ